MATERDKERQRVYSRKHEDKRKEAGDTRHVVWLSAEATAALQRLTVVGTPSRREEIFNRAIIELSKQK